ncbi:LOW QUALITY PROTEIN: hypothetical protein RJ641_032436, partial [Dillenia turbinata]
INLLLFVRFEEFVKYGMVIRFNVTMWGCYVNTLKALSSRQATVTNFATNFLSSGLAGFFLFGEVLSPQGNGNSDHRVDILSGLCPDDCNRRLHTQQVSAEKRSKTD